MSQIKISDADCAGKRKKTQHCARGDAVHALRPVDGTSAVDGNGGTPLAKRMNAAQRGEDRWERARSSQSSREQRLNGSDTLALSRCSNLL